MLRAWTRSSTALTLIAGATAAAAMPMGGTFTMHYDNQTMQPITPGQMRIEERGSGLKRLRPQQEPRPALRQRPGHYRGDRDDGSGAGPGERHDHFFHAGRDLDEPLYWSRQHRCAGSHDR